jgi:broad specificity phosphatase PhoE
LSERNITLIRHGRSAHAQAGWIDRPGFLRWRAAYEAAGIADGETPPPALQRLAASAGLLVASNIPRAIESARLLAPGAEVAVSPLLRELELAPPHLGTLRLPLFAWALAYGVRMLVRQHEHVTPAEHARAREVAAWLAGLAEEHGTVVAVTHQSFRSILSKALVAEGWRIEIPRRRSAHWSAWSLSR